MLRLFRNTIVLLALCAVAFVAYDYCAGHMDLHPWDILHCPVCNSFIANETVDRIDVGSLFIGVYRLAGVVWNNAPHAVRGVSHDDASRRGPPQPPCCANAV